MIAMHPLLAVGPFNVAQAEIDYNLMLLRRMRIVAWDCSTATLLKIHSELMSDQYPLRRINVPFAA